MTAEDSFSIDELARAAGMTTRNVRAYRTKGLLPPPVRAGRTSQYRTAHLRRLRDIRELREAGLPLKLIMTAAGRGEDLGPGSPLRLLAARLEQAEAVDVRDDTLAEPAHRPGHRPGRRPAAVDGPQQRAAMRRLREIGFAPATARLICLQIVQHGAALAADLGDAVAGQAPGLSLEGRSRVADVSQHLTGSVVRRALGVTD